MTVFTNPSQGTQEETDAYVQALLGLLGDQDPLAVLERFPQDVPRTTAGLSDAQLRTPEAPGKWSIVVVLHNLADAELVWSVRVRMALGEDAPPLTGYDQDAWATRMRYRDASPEVALALLELPIEATNELLKTCATSPCTGHETNYLIQHPFRDRAIDDVPAYPTGARQGELRIVA